MSRGALSMTAGAGGGSPGLHKPAPRGVEGRGYRLRCASRPVIDKAGAQPFFFSVHHGTALMDRRQGVGGGQS